MVEAHGDGPVNGVEDVVVRERVASRSKGERREGGDEGVEDGVVEDGQEEVDGQGGVPGLVGAAGYWHCELLKRWA